MIKVLPKGWWKLAAEVLAGAVLILGIISPVRAQVNPYHPPLTQAMPPLDVLVAQFERIAFSNEYGGQHRLGRIVKWQRPVRIRIRGRNAHRYRHEVAEMVTQLRRLSGLNMELLERRDQPGVNFEIEFVDSRPPGKALCETIFRLKYFAIVRVHIFITAKNPPQRKHCIVEEMTQALGLGDDSSLIFPSIFNDSSRQQDLRLWDEIMLQTLYSARLFPGIRKKSARPIVRATIAGLIARIPATTHSPPPDAGESTDGTPFNPSGFR